MRPCATTQRRSYQAKKIRRYQRGKYVLLVTLITNLDSNGRVANESYSLRYMLMTAEGKDIVSVAYTPTVEQDELTELELEDYSRIELAVRRLYRHMTMAELKVKARRAIVHLVASRLQGNDDMAIYPDYLIDEELDDLDPACDYLFNRYTFY